MSPRSGRAQLGLKTAIVERERLGGICLNWGCIPTKALLRTSEIYHYMTHAADYGLKADKSAFDLDKVVERSRKVAGQLNAGVKGLMKKNKVTVHEGVGALTGQGQADGQAGRQDDRARRQAHHVATGARARDLPFAKADGKRIWTYRHAMVPTEMPTKLLVIGSGAIGVEFASFYNDMGAEVTIVEMLPRILPVEDEEVSRVHGQGADQAGHHASLTGAGLEKLETSAQAASRRRSRARTARSRPRSISHVIVAIGIVPNTEDIGLEALGVETERGHIKVDGYRPHQRRGRLRDRRRHRRALAGAQGEPRGRSSASRRSRARTRTRSRPGTSPAAPIRARRSPVVGLTEAKAKEAGHEVKVGKFPFIGNGKAIALGEAEGFVKTVFDAKTGELLGAHMVGAEVTELIQGYVVARQLETTEAELMETVFAHPTLSAR